MRGFPIPSLGPLATATALALAAALAVLAASPAPATPARDAPRPPTAAAYRLTLFLGNLDPVPWEEIARGWTEPHRGSDFTGGAFDRIDPENAPDAAALKAAIGRRDRQALFAAATRLIAREIESDLDAALAADGPADAQRAAAAARGLYRAFADHIAAADPDAGRRIGYAWLELADAAGSAGVLGAGATAPDRAAMAKARAEISAYLAENYLIDDFTPRSILSAVPETVARRGETIRPPAALPPGGHILDQDPLPRLVLGFEEQGIDERDLPLVAYGDMLFDSPRIFGDPARELGIACSTCHNRSGANGDFFIPGLSRRPGSVDVDGAFFNPLFNDRRDDPIDIPALHGLRFTGPYGRDGRFAGLRDFTRNVIVNEFAGPEPTPFMLDALVAYMIEFDFPPNAMIGRDGRLTEAAPRAAHRGEAIFNRPFEGLQGRSCADCHIPDAHFLDRRTHNIGSAAPAYDGAQTGAFDTPTLLGAAHTAPYFHDGSLPTLASVTDWFNATKSLGLDESERADLTAYLEVVGGADRPHEVFDEYNTPFRLAFAELTTFASTLDTLLPRRDARHILLLTDTVSADLAADAGAMSNLSARREIYDLAARLASVGDAVRARDWAGAEDGWAGFKALADAVRERAF